METLILFTIMIVSFVAYLFIISDKSTDPKKPLKSVSAGFYELPTKQRCFTLLSYAGFVIPAIIITDTLLMLLAGSAILVTSVTAAYRITGTTMKVHIYSANIGIALAELSIIIDFNMWWMVVIFAVLSGILYIKKVYTRVYWIEVLAFVTIATTIAANFNL